MHKNALEKKTLAKWESYSFVSSQAEFELALD